MDRHLPATRRRRPVRVRLPDRRHDRAFLVDGRGSAVARCRSADALPGHLAAAAAAAHGPGHPEPHREPSAPGGQLPAAGAAGHEGEARSAASRASPARAPLTPRRDPIGSDGVVQCCPPSERTPVPDLNVSFAQNGEDIVLWRALGHVEGGVYLDVGANDPTDDSVTRKFYDAGWSGIAVEPNPAYAAAFRAERPRDTVFEAVASDSADETMQLHLIEGTGLSTLIDGISADHAQSGFSVRDIEVPVISLDHAIEQAGLAERDLHFLSIDTEGAEAQVLASLDFTRFRPWVLVIEATAPMSTKRVHEGWSGIVERAGYEFCFFDGLSRFYVASERAGELKADLEYPAGILDAYTPIRQLDLQNDLAEALAEVATTAERLHSEATRRAAAAARVATVEAELARSREHEAELGQLVADLQQTLSWRVTKPLRGVRSRLHRS
ncbi:hypothetical protein B7R22_03485 [Subtercola boreus]|uniref:Methyltransferase FkbM domain-containing protein n=1 Tax=Subtercola boreus TaxID=120213 RepID=A0A3E0W4X9_9MICO|nr:hypothetical protein B7R22_03485 [Subtercola boreus]